MTTKSMLICLRYHALFRMYSFGLHSLLSLIIVALGTYTILVYKTPDKVGFSIHYTSPYIWKAFVATALLAASTCD